MRLSEHNVVCGSVLLVGLLLLPVTLTAQRAEQSGIAGVVRDTSGAVLPGVTVEAASPALIEKVRTVVTDGEGRYSLVDLRPGSYAVTFTLAGFGTVKRDGIELPGGFTATVNGELKVGTIEETVTVSGAAPLVDTQNVKRQNSISETLLATLPTGSQSFGALANVVPGVSFNGTIASNTGSGGVYAENQTVGNQRGGSSFHGKSGLNAMYDGMNINDGKGQHGYVANAYTAEEMIVETGGISAESKNTSVTFNMIPKEGGNTFRGSGDGHFATSGMQTGSNVTAVLRARQYNTPSHINYIRDGAVTLGGPIAKDKLWFFTAHRLTASKNVVGGVFYNATQGTPFYTPDLSRPGNTEEWYRADAVRLTWQVSAKNKVNVFGDNMHDDTRKYFAAGQAPEVFTHYDFTPTGLYQVTWSSPVTNRLLIQAGASAAMGHFPVLRQAGVTPDTIAIMNNTAGLLYNAKLPNGATYGIRDSNRYVQRFSVSYITGSHAFKTGFTLDEGTAHLEVGGTPNGINGIGDGISYVFTGPLAAPTPSQIVEYTNPFIQAYRMNADLGIFAQDQWAINRLTLNLGLRYDYFNSKTPRQVEPAGPFVPARTYAAVLNTPNWKDLQPRVGGSYDLFGNARTALKAYVGRYPGTQGSNAIATATNPVNLAISSAFRTWTDDDHDYVPNCDLTNPAANNECGAISDPNFGRANPKASSYADDVLHGWGVRDYTWEVSAEVQQQLGRGWSVQGGYYRNWLGNFTVTDNKAIRQADFTPYSITAPTTPQNGQYLPRGGGDTLSGLYDITPEAFPRPSQNVVDLASHYGKQTQVDDFFAVNFNGRFAKDIRVGGGVDTGRKVTDNCFVVNSPQQLFQCHQVVPFKGNTSVKMNWTVPLPYDVMFSGTFQNVQGTPILATFTASNAVIAPSLGRNLGACGAAATCSASVTGINLIAPGALFEARPTQVDLRVSKILRVTRRTTVQLNLDLYNVLNGSGILQRNNAFGAVWGQPQLIQEPRMAQFGGRVTF
jgi:hypothetical protein